MSRSRDARGRYVPKSVIRLNPKVAALLTAAGAAAGGAYQTYQYGKKAYEGYSALKEVKKNLWPKPQTSKVRPSSKLRTSRRTKTGSVATGSVSSVAKGRPVKRPTKNFTRGVQITREQGQVVTADYCQYIGHATCPLVTMKKCFFRGLVKQLLIKAGRLNPDFNQLWFQGNPSVDRFLFRYQQAEQNGILTFNYLTVLGETQESLAMVLYNHFAAETNQWSPVSFGYWPNPDGLGGTTMWLKNAHIDIACHSEFKFQNRTVNFADQTEADEVTNAPLQGKSYEGSGTGTNFLLPLNPFSMYASNNDGTIEYNGDGIEGLKEPPAAKLFSQVKTTSSIMVGPGEIKVSKLSYNKTMTIRDFVRKIYGTLDSVVKQHNTIGTFRMFGLEKMMQVLPVVTEADNIRIAYEHDLKCSIAISPGYQTYTTTLFTDQAGQTPT